MNPGLQPNELEENDCRGSSSFIKYLPTATHSLKYRPHKPARTHILPSQSFSPKMWCLCHLVFPRNQVPGTTRMLQTLLNLQKHHISNQSTALRPEFVVLSSEMVPEECISSQKKRACVVDYLVFSIWTSFAVLNYQQRESGLEIPSTFGKYVLWYIYEHIEGVVSSFSPIVLFVMRLALGRGYGFKRGAT